MAEAASAGKYEGDRKGVRPATGAITSADVARYGTGE
jgi:hypothetical protein